MPKGGQPPGNWIERLRIAAMAGRFALVGAGCAALNLAIMYVGTVLLSVRYVFAALSTCFITIPLSYLFHRRITFQVSGAWRGERDEFLRFVASQLMQFGVGLGLLIVLVEWAGLTPMWGSVVMTATMFAYGFIVNSTWVFKVLGRRTGNPAPIAASRPPRLLQVSAFFAKHGGGIEVVADRIARSMAAAGADVHWFAGGSASELPDRIEPRLMIHQARSVDFVERRFGFPSPLWSFASLRQLWIAAADCDLLQVHDYLYVPTMLAILFAKARGKPVVLTQHIGPIAFESSVARAVLSALNRTLGRICIQLADQVVFVGRPVKKYFEGFAKFRRAAVIIPNGVDHEVYRPAGDRPPGGGPLRCLFVGRFVEKKGLPLIKQCIDLPGVHWTFIGWGPMSPRDWQSPADNVLVYSDLRAQDVVPHFQTADLLVLPSTGEGFPLVVQEALACGTPVLVSTEVAEAFPTRDSSCVFDVELRTRYAANSLRNRLLQLSQQREMLQAVRGNAARLSQQWSWQRCTEEYREVYRKLAGKDGL